MWKLKNPKLKTIKDVVLANTGLTDEDLLNPKYGTIKKLKEAVALILDAIDKEIPINIVGDYDVDGVCACVILWLMLKAKSASRRVKIRIPRRFSEGYGINTSIIDELTPGLLITVDNGIVAHEAIAKAKKKGFTCIITDHHLGPEDGILPDADIIIDPNAIPDSADFPSYCGAGLAYKLAVELLGEGHSLVPTLEGIAAIATVADVVPLVGENRLIVKGGLNAIERGHTTMGLRCLLELCSLNRVITAEDVAFKIGPIINAPGRLADTGAMDSLRLLCYNGSLENAKAMAKNIYDVNETRKKLKAVGLEIIEQIIEDECLYGECPLVVKIPRSAFPENVYPEGLLGIYAGTLAEKYQVPCFVFSDDEDGDYKGSARSFGGVHLKNLLDQNAHLLKKFGGHAEAAGLTVAHDDYYAFKSAVQESVGELEISEDRYYDLEIPAESVPWAIQELKKYEPFGAGNPEPIFLIKDYRLTPTPQGFYKTLGENKDHLRLFNEYANAIGFGMAPAYIDAGEPRLLSLIGTISSKYFMGKTSNQVGLLDFIPEKAVKAKPPLAALLEQKAKENKK